MAPGTRSVRAGADAADVIAIDVELADPAAAAIAVVVIAAVAGGDRAADDGGTHEACTDAPAITDRLGLRRGGGSDRAGGGKGGEGEGSELGLERHFKLH